MEDDPDPAPRGPARASSDGLPVVRQNKLLKGLRERGQMTVQELMEELKVSRDTVRRDLDQLEQRGLVTRTHGGAVYNDGLVRIDTTVGSRMDAFVAAKQRIAKAAAQLVHDGETLIVNGGSSTCYFAGALGAKRNLTLITNNMRILPVAPEKAIRSLHVLGGIYWPISQVTIGTVGFPDVVGISADTAVVSATGLSAAGLTMGRIEEAAETAAMIRIAGRVIALIDQSKFGINAFARIVPLNQISVIVTDEWPPDPILAAIKKAGVQLIVA
jgi:DeoR/GlpR family transcriptional regulator of sugar metabolism